MPTNDGGWPMQGTTDILGLPLVDSVDCLPDDPLIAFSDDTNKIQPFVRYYKTQKCVRLEELHVRRRDIIILRTTRGK